MNLLDNEKNEMNYVLRKLENCIFNQKDEEIKNKYITLKSQYYRQRESQKTLANLTKTYLSTGLFLIVLAVSLLVESGADTILLEILLASAGIVPIVSAEETINMSKKNKIELKQTINSIHDLEQLLVRNTENKEPEKLKYSYSFTKKESIENKKESTENEKSNTLVKTKKKQ